MAKGKTNQPLHILVTDQALWDTPEVQKLVEQGHSVALTHDLAPYDRIMGPTCYRMNATLLPFLTLAIKDCRAEKRSRKKGEQ